MDPIKQNVENVSPRNRAVVLSESTELSIYQKHVRVSAAATITLPSVSEAAGMIFTIVRTGAGTVTVQVNDSDSNIKKHGGAAYTTDDLTANGAHLVVMSDGVSWFELSLSDDAA